MLGLEGIVRNLRKYEPGHETRAWIRDARQQGKACGMATSERLLKYFGCSLHLADSQDWQMIRSAETAAQNGGMK
jgi:hypothetical protein